MMRNPYFERMIESYKRNRTGNTALKAVLVHHEQQRELHKQHLHLLGQTFARTRQHAVRGDYKEVQNAYKDYVSHSKKLMKQSRDHFSKFHRETQPDLHKHWKAYSDFSQKAAKQTLATTQKVADAITPKEVKRTAKAISSLAPVKAAQSMAKKTTTKLAKKASALSKGAPKTARSLSPLKSSSSSQKVSATKKSIKPARKVGAASSRSRTR